MTGTGSEITRAEALAEIARTLGHANRLVLLEHIAQGECPVERLAARADLTVANASQHLQHLRRAGLVRTRRDGKRVLYRLGGGPVLDLLDALGRYAAHQRAEVLALLSDSRRQPERLEAVSRDELLRRLSEDSVTVIDVRPAEEFARGHLPGAISLPLEDLEQRLAALPPNQEIVAYCRGPNCVLSVDAVAVLRAQGLAARRLENGFLDWKVARLPIETAA